jgi:TM2 domain-containing membrane protein YozV
MNGVCPYCRTSLELEDEVTSCAACNTPHHAACMAENGGCTVFGCSQAPADDVKVSVLVQDLQPVAATSVAVRSHPAQSHSILNLEVPAEPPPSVDPPPPQPVPAPPRGGSTGVPPPPPPAGSAPISPPTAVPVIFSGYGAPISPGAGGYDPRKNRVVFVLLAVFLGAVGAHNFYAGYTRKAVIQLCITVFSCSIGGIVSWIWAVVEACTVNRDDDGVEFI